MMECVDLTVVLQYYVIGIAYTVVKQFALKEYYNTRLFWVRLVHGWFESSLWPVDFLYHTVKLFIHNGRG